MLAALRSGIRPTDDEHRVTSLELLFDLVFVYAITGVAGLMEHQVGGRTLLEGLITLALVWFGWVAYAWLGNQARADEGVLRLALIIAMVGMFFVAVSIPSSFSPGSNAAWVLAFGYALERLTHIGCYLLAAGEDRLLRSVVRDLGLVALAALVPLFVGAAVSPENRMWWWLAAVLIDQAGVYFVGSTRWQLASAAHFAERFGLIVLIAIGESVVSVGVAVAVPHQTLRLAVALLCGLSISICLWWLYFDVVTLVAERVLRGSSGVARARLARDSYSYLHLPMVAGIVLTAMGQLLLIRSNAHGPAPGGIHVDAGRAALYGGIALYLAAHLGFRLRNIGSLNIGRLIAALVVLALLPSLAGVDPLWQLAAPALVLTALVIYEVRAHADWRREVRAEA